MKSLAVKIWLSLALALLMAYTGFSVWKNATKPRDIEVDSPPPVVATLPPQPVDLASYHMTERSGRELTLDELRGEVWIANTFFSVCTAECLTLNRTVAVLQQDPHYKGVRFVSITVDPAEDTTERLRSYADGFSADPKRWLFVRGTLGDVGRFGEDVKIGAAYRQHTGRLVLFDRHGTARGAFMYNDPQQMHQLRELVPKLLAEKGAKAEKTPVAEATSAETKADVRKRKADHKS